MGKCSKSSEKLAWKIRKNAIEMVHIGNASHIAAALSAADILAVLYENVLQIDPHNPELKERDRFVMSKGHAGAAVYAVLAEKGFFPTEELKSYYKNGSVFSGHVSHKGIPGIEMSTGSLGHGIAVACGMALASQSSSRPYNVYTLIGDGECNEGVVWEIALIANQYHLDNFTVVIDRNGMQAMGRCEEVMQMEPLAKKWESFGWTVIDLKDGNCHAQLRAAFSTPSHGRPKCIIARTIKGKGISFMENDLVWHYKSPQGDLYVRAIKELEATKP